MMRTRYTYPGDNDDAKALDKQVPGDDDDDANALDKVLAGDDDDANALDKVPGDTLVTGLRHYY